MYSIVLCIVWAFDAITSSLVKYSTAQCEVKIDADNKVL